MSTKYLGENFDIHGGGMDLKFPHHECEIAQNQGATGVRPVNYWLHTNMLTVNGRKMSKSEGNGFTPDELLTGNHKLLEQGYSAMTVRFFMLMCHYSSTLDFSNAALQAAEKGYARMMNAWKELDNVPVSDSTDVDVAALEDRCAAAMNDDFNTPILISVLFDAVKTINSAIAGSVKMDAPSIEGLRKLMDDYLFSVMGLKVEDESGGDDGIESEIMEVVIALRKEAREQKDYALSDSIRDKLAAIDIQLKDGPEGTSWLKG